MPFCFSKNSSCKIILSRLDSIATFFVFIATFFLFHTFRSLHNPLEREYVLALTQSMVTHTEIKQSSIGIITPYRQQAQLIRQNFTSRQLSEVTVNTIDGYQGQEKDVIILSCVRGPNQKNTIGFLSHPQRMNVALTRAKKTFVVLANHSVQVSFFPANKSCCKSPCGIYNQHLLT